MSRTKLALIAAAAAAIPLAACSSHANPATKPPATVQQNAVSQTTPPATSSSTPAAAPSTTDASALAGHWSGQYGGSYSGTFSLNWQQTGSSLSGTITLSNPPGTLDIHGTVNGGSIQFGTVGSEEITYTGSVSGGSMSGSYQVGTGAGGSWSASKS